MCLWVVQNLNESLITLLIYYRKPEAQIVFELFPSTQCTFVLPMQNMEQNSKNKITNGLGLIKQIVSMIAHSFAFRSKWFIFTSVHENCFIYINLHNLLYLSILLRRNTWNKVNAKNSKHIFVEILSLWLYLFCFLEGEDFFSFWCVIMLTRWVHMGHSWIYESALQNFSYDVSIKGAIINCTIAL